MVTSSSSSSDMQIYQPMSLLLPYNNVNVSLKCLQTTKIEKNIKQIFLSKKIENSSCHRLKQE